MNEHGIIEHDFTNEEWEDENNNIDVEDSEDSLIGSSDMDLKEKDKNNYLVYPFNYLEII